MPSCRDTRILGVTHQLLQAQLIYAAIRLDVFSYLQIGQTAESLAKETGYDVRNVDLLLHALASTGFIVKEGEHFLNAPDTELYLNKASELYLGDYMTFWYKAKDLSQLEERVRYGASYRSFHDPLGSDSYDFKTMGEVSAIQMYTGRVQHFITAMAQVLAADKPLRALDLGGGSGVLAIELVKHFPHVQAVVYDQAAVIPVAQAGIAEHQLQQQIKTQTGNFVTDDFGKGYDLVIASGILDFCGEPDEMLARIYAAMNPGGYLYTVTHQINDAFTEPSQAIIGFLAARLDGLDILKTNTEIARAIEKAGFRQQVITSEQVPYALYRKA